MVAIVTSGTVVTHGYQWLPMVTSGYSWLPMVDQWLLMVTVVTSGYSWLPMVDQWLLMVQQWLLMVTVVTRGYPWPLQWLPVVNYPLVTSAGLLMVTVVHRTVINSRYPWLQWLPWWLQWLPVVTHGYPWLQCMVWPKNV